jgi:hypothetical protein
MVSKEFREVCYVLFNKKKNLNALIFFAYIKFSQSMYVQLFKTDPFSFQIPSPASSVLP